MKKILAVVIILFLTVACSKEVTTKNNSHTIAEEKGILIESWGEVQFADPFRKRKPRGSQDPRPLFQDTIQNNTIHFRCAPCPSKENTERWLKMQRGIDSITALPGSRLKPIKNSRYGNNSN